MRGRQWKVTTVMPSLSGVSKPSSLKFKRVSADADSAIAAIQRLLKVPGGITRGDPRFNPFWDLPRKDPRFQQLLGDKQSNRA